MWLPYDELYEICTDTGDIRNRKTGYVLKPYVDVYEGRNWVCIHRKKMKISRMIGLALFPRIIRPKDEVDHLNYDKTDDRPCNLQWKSKSANQRNNRAENIHVKTTRVKGHIYQRYCVQFRKDKKSIYCKLFKTLEEAIEARDAFKNSEEFRMSM
jgi:hypothetical protein